MAKENKKTIAPLVLFSVATFFLCSGWLMKSFPVFLLVGLAPLFALTDRVKANKPFWDQFELILLSLSLAFFASHLFQADRLVISIVQAILLTLPFIAYGFAKQSLGPRVGKFTIILFWLSAEYLLLKLPWREQFVFLADGFELHLKWFGWTKETGYLGISLWILLSNLLVYLFYFKNSKIEIPWLVAFLLFVGAPLLASIWFKDAGIDKSTMMDFYNTNQSVRIEYQKVGELVVRTSAWISSLIILFSFVRNKTNKK